jgi:signal transduction histidine kinase
VLAQEATRAAAAGQSELAATLEQQVERMRRHVEYHLAHARAAASGPSLGARTRLADSLEALDRTLRRLYAERSLRLDFDVPTELAVRVDRQDLDEILGNVLDNACKWARSRVAVACSREHDDVLIAIDDDGPGLPEPMREAVLQRGVRADEAAPGSGLGLAIVRDLAQLYGGRVELDSSPLGGLRAQLRLPAA